jgi:phospholipid transport system substrate-binding protein
MLVRIYSNSIDVYRGQTMKVLPMRGPKDASEAVVRNQYMNAAQKPVIVEYAMRKEPDGWKIYDITVEGVSLVLTYRAEFDSITRTSGVDGLIKRLQQKNA